MSNYIAIDGGGTKTEFVLFNEEGKILAYTLQGGSNVNVSGVEVATGNIRNGLQELTCQFKPDGVFAGIAGSSTPGNSDVIYNTITSCVNLSQVHVKSDILNVIHSVPDVGKCIAVICGTGSSVFAWDEKQIYPYGGWGYRFDRAGGGYDIGCDVLRECLAYNNGFGKSSIVTQLAEEKIGGKAIEHLNELYSGNPDEIGKFAPYAFAAYKQGDDVAKKILYRNFKRVAELIMAADKYSFNSSNHAVIISGGLTKESDIVTEILDEILEKKYDFVFPDMPQIYGAAVAALKFCSNSIKSTDMIAFYKNFVKDYEKIKKGSTYR